MTSLQALISYLISPAEAAEHLENLENLENLGWVYKAGFSELSSVRPDPT